MDDLRVKWGVCKYYRLLEEKRKYCLYLVFFEKNQFFEERKKKVFFFLYGRGNEGFVDKWKIYNVLVVQLEVSINRLLLN